MGEGGGGGGGASEGGDGRERSVMLARELPPYIILRPSHRKLNLFVSETRRPEDKVNFAHTIKNTCDNTHSYFRNLKEKTHEQSFPFECNRLRQRFCSQPDIVLNTCTRAQSHKASTA